MPSVSECKELLFQTDCGGLAPIPCPNLSILYVKPVELAYCGLVLDLLLEANLATNLGTAAGVSDSFGFWDAIAHVVECFIYRVC